MKLQDKVAVVTGASEGLGKQICLKLAKEGVNLALLARTKSKLEKVASESKKLGSKEVQVYACDIRDISQLKRTTKKIISDFMRVNILVNNAGIWHKRGQLESISEDLIEDVIRTNLTGLIQFTRLLLPQIRKQKDAAVVNIASRSGVRAAEGQSVYSASKWGVRGFTEVLRADLANTQVRVTAVYQAGVRTKLFEKANEAMPTEKYMEPTDLADVVVFMLSRPKQIWLHDMRVEY